MIGIPRHDKIAVKGPDSHSELRNDFSSSTNMQSEIVQIVNPETNLVLEARVVL
jgi:hypothetical protein